MLKITILLLGLFWCLGLWIEGREAAKSRATLRNPASRGACKRHTREIYGLSADRGRIAGRRIAGILQNYRYGSDDDRCFRQ